MNFIIIFNFTFNFSKFPFKIKGKNFNDYTFIILCDCLFNKFEITSFISLKL